MVLDRYDSTGTGILSEQDKARLVEDARSARREARKAFLRKFDKDGDGRLSPEEYRAFREHVEKRRGVRRPDAGPDKRDGIPFYSPAERKEILRRPLRQRGWKCPWWKFRTVGRKHFMVAPGLFLLTRNMLLQNYDANGTAALIRRNMPLS